MAKEPAKAADDDEADTGEKKPAKKKALWARLLTPKGLAILIGASLVVHGIVFAGSKLMGPSAAARAAAATEIDLGTFQFKAEQHETGQIGAAEFNLHISLLDQLRPAAGMKLAMHEFRVQQDIEELLRQAHGGDFDDPTLSELKRQLQERINETLGLRAIADVIITDLKLDYRDGQETPMPDAAETALWVEDPSEEP